MKRNGVELNVQFPLVNVRGSSAQVVAVIVRSRTATSFTHSLPTRPSLILHKALSEALGMCPVLGERSLREGR